MKALIQKVTEASVTVGEDVTGRIGPGLLVLLGISKSDQLQDCDWLTSKIANLRIFSADQKNFDQSALDIQAPILLISQFTLCAKPAKGGVLTLQTPQIQQKLEYSTVTLSIFLRDMD